VQNDLQEPMANLGLTELFLIAGTEFFAQTPAKQWLMTL
jgi:hypothetical protein